MMVQRQDEPDFLKLMELEFEFMRRRLRGMAMISRGIVPNLVLSQRAVAKMLSAAGQYLADETGEAMVGFVIEDDTPEGLPTIYVLDTISPDETAIRRSHTFQQGDDIQDEILIWLRENWHFYREQHRGTEKLPERFDLPLRYLGDWHKQPGSMIQPSHGDLMTALSLLDDDEVGMDYLLVPIVTVGHAQIIGASDVEVNYITVPMGDGTDMRVDWWYIHRDVRVFQPLHPQVVEAEELPEMMKYGWHVVYEERLNQEYYRLETDGAWISALILWESDDVPLEICFIVARQGARELMLLITDADYPNTPPKARMSPSFHGLDLTDEYKAFSELWERSKPVELADDWEWDNNLYLLDFVIAIEEHLGLRQPSKVTIPVVDDEDEDDPVVVSETDAGEDDGNDVADDKPNDTDEGTIDEDTKEEAT
jgi:hypothetical protein